MSLFCSSLFHSSIFHRCRTAVSAAAVLGIASAAGAQVPSQYTITDLGTLASSTINPTGINASGVVIGYSNVPTPNATGVIVSSPHAFKTGANGAGGAQDMGLMPYTPGTVAGTYARGINDSGMIVGYGTTAVPAASTKSNYNHSFISTNGTTLTDIGTLGAATITLKSGTVTANNSLAYGVSNNGYVTGYGTDAQNGDATAINFHAYRYNSNTETGLSSKDDLGTMGTGAYSYGYGVNNAGTVVGRANINTTSFIHAFRDTLGGAMQDLGTLGTTNTTNSNASEALAINSAGTIVGDSYDNSYVQDAYVLKANENGITSVDKLFQVSGDVVGGIGSVATAISDTGQIVGYVNVDTTLAAYVYHAFVYNGDPASGGTAYDLNNYLSNGTGWTLQYAEGVNSAGQITGYGTINGVTHAFLLTPSASAVPEPGAVVLLAGSALTGLGVVARRKRAIKAGRKASL